MTDLQHLKDRHKHLHNLIEAAEAEKAPEDFIKNLKVEKLEIKDKIARIENAN